MLAKPHKPRSWMLIIVVELLLIFVVVGLVIASIYLRSYQHRVCVNQRQAFSYVNQLDSQRIAALKRSLKHDRSMHATAKVTLDLQSLGPAKALASAVTPPQC